MIGVGNIAGRGVNLASLERTLDVALALEQANSGGNLRHGDACSSFPVGYGLKGSSHVFGTAASSAVYGHIRYAGVASGGTFRRYKGKLCLALNPGAASSRSLLMFDHLAAPLLEKPTQGVFDGESLPPLGYVRLVAVLAAPAYNAAPVADTDIGLYFISNRDSSVGLLDSMSVEGGFGIAYRQDGTWRFVSKTNPNGALGGTGPTTVGDALAGTNGVGEFNAFEIRVFSATPTQDAYIELWVNGVKRETRSWGTGTVLPNPSSIGNSTGFFPAVNYHNGNSVAQTLPAPGLYVANLRLIGGPTEASIR